MNKKHLIIGIAIIVLFILCILIGFFYHDEIDSIIKDDKWDYLEPYSSVKDVQSQSVFGRTLLGVCTKNGFSIYKNNELETKEEFISSETLSHSMGPYTGIYAKDIKTYFLLRNSEIAYKKELNIEPKIIRVNASGYSAIIYSQAGYKSGVKVFKPNGEDLITKYLASSYATCADVSLDNSLMFLGEVNGSGIKVKSYVEIIDLATQESKQIGIGNGEIITDVKQSGKNLLVQTDMNVYKLSLDSNELIEMMRFDTQNTVGAYIDSDDLIVTILNNGMDDVSLNIKKDEQEYNITLEMAPQSVDIYNNIIALNFGHEVWIFDDCKLRHKIQIEEALSNIRIVSYGKEIALIYRNRIEVVKIK